MDDATIRYEVFLSSSIYAYFAAPQWLIQLGKIRDKNRRVTPDPRAYAAGLGCVAPPGLGPMCAACYLSEMAS